MARNPDIPCAKCGRLLWRGSTSLPRGEATCRPCRREANPRRHRHLPPHRIDCGGPKPTLKHRYCKGCKKGRSPSQMAGRTTAMGYGHQHQMARARLVPLVAQGGFICTRYGHPQFPDCTGEIQAHDPAHAAEVWELGHDDTDKGRYTGPEHKGCNRRAGGLKRIGKLIANRESTLRW